MNTFATPAPVTAIVDIPAGSIHLIADGLAETTVEVRPADPSKGRDVKLAEQITAGYLDGIVKVTAPDANRVLGSSGAADVTVHLPAGSAVQAKAASVRFTTQGPLGEVSFDGAQATINVEDAASVRLVIADGSITVGRLGDGDSEIRTARGDLEVGSATGGTLVLRSETGAITVGAAAGVCAALDAGTTMGRIHNSLASTGTPGLNIHATSTMGDITARSL